MEDLLSLVDELKQQVKSEDAPTTVTTAPSADRWLLRSALQKAVRRGQAHRAAQLADGLREIDPDSFWRSLAVIAVEDVGFGDPDMITFTTAAISKTVRSRVGDDSGLARSLVHRMCRAPKSRACCELSVAVDMGRPDLIQAMGELPDHDVIDALQAQNCGTVYVALGLIRGRFPGRPPRTGVARALVEEILTDRLSRDRSAARAAVHAFRRPVDTMSFALAPVTRMLLDQPDARIVDETSRWREGAEIMGIQAEAYDRHTRSGGLALKALHTSLSRRHAWLGVIHKQRAARALGSAVFLEEGGLVDRRLDSPALAILRECQDRALMTAYGLPEILHDRVRALVKEEVPRLNRARTWAVSLGR